MTSTHDREQARAALAAERWSEAAERVTVHTVHRHVASIYSALGLGSRAAAAAYAASHGLV